MLLTVSVWPSSAARKGFAKIFSSFVAFSARLYSRALANGCISGAVLRGLIFTSDASSLPVAFFSLRARALNFIVPAERASRGG